MADIVLSFRVRRAGPIDELAAVGKDAVAALTGKSGQRLVASAGEIIKADEKTTFQAISSVWRNRFGTDLDPAVQEAKTLIEQMRGDALADIRADPLKVNSKNLALLKTLAYAGEDYEAKVALESLPWETRLQLGIVTQGQMRVLGPAVVAGGVGVGYAAGHHAKSKEQEADVPLAQDGVESVSPQAPAQKRGNPDEELPGSIRGSQKCVFVPVYFRN